MGLIGLEFPFYFIFIHFYQTDIRRMGGNKKRASNSRYLPTDWTALVRILETCQVLSLAHAHEDLATRKTTGKLMVKVDVA